MHFAAPLPWWLALVVAAAVAVLAWFSYRRPLVPLTLIQRGVLMALRATALGAVVVFLCRPIVMAPPPAAGGIVVPILVDDSRSMRVADADGRSRIARAADLLTRDLLPALSTQFTPEIYTIGDAVTPASPDRLAADERRSDLTGALAAIRDRYRGRRVSGIVVLSDGGETNESEPRDGETPGPPVFTIGIGSPEGPADREILSVTAGDPRLDQTAVDLHVSALSARFGRAPFTLRLLANGRLLESRSVAPVADGSPVEEIFTVAPDPLSATVYTAEIAAGPDESVLENNTRSVLVSPAGRKRRILVLEGAPGHEHSFMTRALTADPGLEFDMVVRKGKNETGQGTYLVQAGPGRAAALTTGFPSSRESLYAYDALVIANVEGEFLPRAALTQAAEFVAERGGGLLVMGGRSLAQHGLIGTPLEDALPVELNDRRGGLMRTTFGGDLPATRNTVTVTAEGAKHPVMRIGSTPDEVRRLWAALPPLAGTAALGGPKPGASVLAITVVAGGAVYPVVAVQRYGRGRSMVFAGEASWRWRMMQPSADRSYEFFWRQAARWLAGPAPDPVSIDAPESPEPGDSIDIAVDVRDRAFQPVPDATVEATLALPGGETHPLTLRHEAGTGGRFVAAVRADHAGAYRVSAEARRGSTELGHADRWIYVGGGDREFADPRLNEGLLRRLARASGGRYVRAADAARIPEWLQSVVPQHAEYEQRDLWQRPWAFAFVIGLLSAEWTLRRRWGLR
jgi:uncharacterized membrane protein